MAAVVLKTGPNGHKLNFNFQNRENKDAIVDLAEALLEICKRVRGGVLVFF